MKEVAAMRRLDRTLLAGERLMNAKTAEIWTRIMLRFAMTGFLAWGIYEVFKATRLLARQVGL
jgi:hypothetical protein